MEYFGYFLNALAVVFFAEMGDKTQLLVMAFTSKYKYRDIILGVSAAIVVLNALAVLVGSLLSNIIDPDVIKLCAGLLFLVFALLSLRGNCEDEEEGKGRSFRLPPAIAVSVAFFIAELGDKTQVTAMTMAAQSAGEGGSFANVMIFAGAVLAMIAANGLGLVFCALLGKCLPDYVFRIISVGVFTLFGFKTLYEALGRFTGAANMPLALGAIAVVFVLIGLAILKPFGRVLKKNGQNQR